MPAPKKHDYCIKDFQWLIRSVFRDIHNGNSAKVWILGAGASMESGISGAGELAHRWACELMNIPVGISKEDALKQWKTEGSLRKFENETAKILGSKKPRDRKINDYLAQRYFDVYSMRFCDPQSGYAALRNEMDGKLPSIGYLILAQLISSKSNLVITVNFDNLVADALFLTGKQLPLILDHESVAHLAKPINDVTLVCKIHRDLLKGPMNRQDELAQLDKMWEAPLNEIFKYYSPIFIGYGGNDKTLMNYLNNVSAFQAPPIWLHYTTKIDEGHIRSEVSPQIAKFLNNHQGLLVPISGFDRLMNLAAKQLDLPDVLDVFDGRSAEIRSGLERKLSKLAEDTGKTADSDIMSKAALSTVKKELRKDFSDWLMIAQSKNNPKERMEVYNQAIRELQHPWFYINRGNTKAEMGDKIGALADYDEAIRIDENDASAFYNRGIVYAGMGDRLRAITDFDKAIHLDPKKINAYSNRGIAKLSLGDKMGAIKEFDTVLRLDPSDASAYYNKACAYSLLNEVQYAVENLNRAIFINSEYLSNAKTDSDFDNIRDHPEFKALFD